MFYKPKIEYKAASERGQKSSREIDARKRVVRLDMAIGLAKIARPMKIGEDRGSFDIKQAVKGGAIRLMGIRLDDRDIGVLLAIVSIAQQQKPQPNKTKNIAGLFPKNIDAKLQEIISPDCENIFLDKSVLTIETSFAEINKELGNKSDGGAGNDRIRESLQRLGGITISIKNGRDWGITNLVHHAKGNTKNLSITIAYRLAEVLIGKASYGAIDMQIFNKLPRGASKILYGHL